MKKIKEMKKGSFNDNEDNENDKDENNKDKKPCDTMKLEKGKFG